MRDIKNQRNHNKVNSRPESMIINNCGTKRRRLSTPHNFDINETNIECDINTITNNLNKKNIKHNSNAIIYTRVSSSKQILGTSLDSQLEICRKYCEENNFKVLYEVSETVSALKIANQKNLLDLINENENFELIVLEPSRFSRNIADFINLYDKLIKEKKIILHFVQDKLVSSNSYDLKKIFSGIYDGELESETLSKRMKRSVKKRRENGTYLPSVPPFGYSYNSILKDGKIIKNRVKNEKEQQLIEFINKLYHGSAINELEEQLEKLTGVKHELYFPDYDEQANEQANDLEHGNMKFIDIANFLNSVDITRRNKDWNSNSVRQLIKL
jgi:DNA invertase Pin-like site-specific DNA recombinase